MFWSKSKEKSAPDPAPGPEPSDPTSAASTDAVTSSAAKDAPTTPEDKDIASTAPSESTWGSRLNTAKQLYGTANQVYTVAQAVPQARAALEPYLTKASTTEDQKPNADLAAEPTDSTQETPELHEEAEKEASNLESAHSALNDVSGSEATPQLQDDSKIEDSAPHLDSEPTLEAEEAEEAETDADVKETPASEDTPASKSVSNPEIKDEAPGLSPNPVEAATLEEDPANIDTDLSSTKAAGETKASEDVPDSEDTQFVTSEPTAEDEPLEAPEKSVDSAEETIAKGSPGKHATLVYVNSIDKLADRNVIAVQHGTETEGEALDASGEDRDLAKEKTAESSSDKDAASKDTFTHTDIPAVHSGADVEGEAPLTSDKSLHGKDVTQSSSTQKEPLSTDTASEALDNATKEPNTQPESSPAITAPEAPIQLTDNEEPKPDDQIKSPSASKPDLTPASDRDIEHKTGFKPVSVPENEATDAIDAPPVSSGQPIASTPGPEDTPAAKSPPAPDTTDETPSGHTEPAADTEQTPDPSSSAEAQPVEVAPEPADGSTPAPATQQPTQEEIEKAADAAKSAARLQSTADALWDQARAIRDPAERERLWRAAYNKEVEAHGQSKKARAMASGWGQGVLSGVGISAAVGVGLGNVVGALLGGVVSLPGTLIGAGVGAAMGPLVKLGGFGGKEGDKKKEKERPKEFDWEEDLSDDEAHQQIVDAVRKDEATAKTEAEAD